MIVRLPAGGRFFGAIHGSPDRLRQPQTPKLAYDRSRRNVDHPTQIRRDSLGCIDTEQGARILLQRIERAAKTACGGHPILSAYTGSLDRFTFDECRGKAVQRAVKQLGAPLVTRFYSEARPRES